MWYNSTMALATVVFKEPTSVIIKGKTKIARVISIPNDKAVTLWWVQEGGKKPVNRAQAAYISRVRRIYLDRTFAPVEYLEKYPVTSDQQREKTPRSWHQRYDNY